MRVKPLFTVLLLLLVSAAEAREPGHYVPGIANIRDFAVPAAPGFYYVQYNSIQCCFDNSQGSRYNKPQP